MQFDVEPDVPEENLVIIRCGLTNGQDFLDRELGGGISDNALANITVRVVADGSSNVCCTASASRIFFDVTHPHWAKDTEGSDEWPTEARREKIVIHEFAHSWQGSLGCLQKLGGSLWDEGIAEQVTYATVVENGFLTKKDVMDFMESAAKSGNGEQWNTPLRDLEANGSSVWPGHIGYLALDYAMNMENATHGPISVRTLCEEVTNGATPEEAFQATFGTDKNSFYAQFEAWKNSQTA
ncbi:MAG: hypothetical protein HYS87_02010 [Candidatus Colwellbacteria bacterium]|nr:hypothetical protein [Candidatus Colwellbacteria bacterium]